MSENQRGLQCSAIIFATLINGLLLFFIFCWYQHEHVVIPLRQSFPDDDEITVLMQKEAEDQNELEPEWVQTTAKQSVFNPSGPVEMPIVNENISSELNGPEGNAENDVTDQKEKDDVSKDDLLSEDIDDNATNNDNNQSEENASIQSNVVTIDGIATSNTSKSESTAVKKSYQHKKVIGEQRSGQPFNIAQIAQGFLDQTKEQGTHSISMMGKQTGQPSYLQIQHERYTEKIFWVLQKTCKMHQHKVHWIGNKTIVIYCELYKNGTIKTFQILESSGDDRLDAFVMFIFNDANGQFPPVPQSLLQDPYTLRLRIDLFADRENSSLFGRK